MTLSNRKEIAEVLTEIVAKISPSWAPRDILRHRLRVLCGYAQRMSLQPEDALTPHGRDAFHALADSISWKRHTTDTTTTLCAEWRTVIQLAA